MLLFIECRSKVEFDRAVTFKKKVSTPQNDSVKYALKIDVGKVENVCKQAFRDMNTVNTISSKAMKDCSTFLGHFVAREHAFRRCPTRRII